MVLVVPEQVGIVEMAVMQTGATQVVVQEVAVAVVQPVQEG
jgi:hypothetical protein